MASDYHEGEWLIGLRLDGGVDDILDGLPDVVPIQVRLILLQAGGARVRDVSRIALAGRGSAHHDADLAVLNPCAVPIGKWENEGTSRQEMHCPCTFLAIQVCLGWRVEGATLIPKP